MAGRTSFAYRMPMTSSSVSRNTGNRACSELRMRSKHLRPRRRRIDADDVDARHHDLLHFRLAEREHAVNQLLLGRRDVGLGGDDLAELLGRRLPFFVLRRRRRNDQRAARVDDRPERDRGAQEHRQPLRHRRESRERRRWRLRSRRRDRGPRQMVVATSARRARCSAMRGHSANDESWTACARRRLRRCTPGRAPIESARCSRSRSANAALGDWRRLRRVEGEQRAVGGGEQRGNQGRANSDEPGLERRHRRVPASSRGDERSRSCRRHMSDVSRASSSG